MVWSWMEVDGFPALLEEEARGLLCEVFHLLFFNLLHLSSILVMDLIH